MSEHGAAFVDGWYRAYRLVNGRYRQYVGPKFDTPSGAARYARLLDEMPEVSPLRDGHDTNTGAHDSVGDVSISDPRERVTGSGTGRQ